jgi:hypothetical protein
MHPQKKALSCLLVRRDLSKRNRPDATAATLNPPAPLPFGDREIPFGGSAHFSLYAAPVPRVIDTGQTSTRRPATERGLALSQGLKGLESDQ